MRWLSFFFLLIAVSACRKPVRPEDISRLNGYWQIEKVILPDGSEKPYIFGGSYDYFEINGRSGFRKKAVPNLDGTFQANDVVEKVDVVFENGKTFLKYSTAYAKWQEKLIMLSSDAFAVVNPEHKEYRYKRAQPINVEPEIKISSKPADSINHPTTINHQATTHHVQAPQ